MFTKDKNIYCSNFINTTLNIPSDILFKSALDNNSDLLIDLMINNGININGDDNNYFKSYLYKALKNRNYYIALILVLKGAKVNYKFDYFKNSLIYDVLYKSPCLCHGNCNCKYKLLSTERIELIKKIIINGCQLVFKKSQNDNISPYKYAENNYFPPDICNLIYTFSKKQGSKEQLITSKDKINKPLENLRNNYNILKVLNEKEYFDFNNFR